MLRQVHGGVVVVLFFSIVVSSYSDSDGGGGGGGGGGGCPPSKVCPEIKYPFRAPDQPSSCGYSSGFDVQYYVNGTCYLRLPLLSSSSPSSSSIDYFIIKNINYSSYRIELTSNIIPAAGDDDNNCLPTKLLSLKLEGTPFNYNYYKNYTLYNCTISKPPQGYNQIGCSSSISNNKLQVLICVDNNSFVNPAGTDHCGFVDTVKFPTTLSSLSTEYHDCTAEKSFFLYWTAPSASPPYMYSPSPASNYNKSAAIGGIVVGTFLLIVVVLPFAICIRKKIQLNGFFRQYQQSAAAPRVVLPPGHLIDQPQPQAASTSSINNNYPLIIIGDSGRMLVNMVDNCCPICLVDYVPQDNLMILPQCLHKFHAHCLNEWLRQKSICPMCRTRPPPRTLT